MSKLEFGPFFAGVQSGVALPGKPTKKEGTIASKAKDVGHKIEHKLEGVGHALAAGLKKTNPFSPPTSASREPSKEKDASPGKAVGVRCFYVSHAFTHAASA